MESATSDTKGGVLEQSEALQQATKQNQIVTNIEEIEGKLFFVAAAPIKRYGEQTLGFLVFGTPFDLSELEQLKQASGSDIVIVRQGKVQSATLKLDGTSNFKILDQKIDTKELRPVEGLHSAGAPLLATAMLLHAGKSQTALIFALSAKGAIALRRQVLYSSTGLALLIMIVSGLIGYLLARRISDPVVEIAQSFREIAASGDLSRRITKNYHDEVGMMAGSFNVMQEQIEGLHARVVSAEQRMRDELKMASAVQELLVPTTTIDGARCQFVSHLETSSETGGDWFTIIHAPDRHLTTVVIVDVTGHGAPSALVTAIIHGFFRATEAELSSLTAANWRPVVDSILGKLNKALIESTRRSLVCSLLLATFDHRTCKVRFINAGHLSPILLKNVGGQMQINMPTFPPSSLVGDTDTPEFAARELQLEPDQFFLMYTDGLVECTNAAHEVYGFKRLRRVLQSISQHQDARSARDVIVQDAYKFFGDMPHADDITMVLGRVR